MTEENKIKTSVRESLSRARKIIEDKSKSIERINYLFSEIYLELGGAVEFDSVIMSDNPTSTIYGVFARNSANTQNPRKMMLRYTFGKPNSFPMEIEVPTYGVYACSDLSEVNAAIEEIATVDDFMLGIISAINEGIEDSHIPF